MLRKALRRIGRWFRSPRASREAHATPSSPEQPAATEPRAGCARTLHATAPTDAGARSDAVAPRHFGDLWQAIGRVAAEEDPAFAERNVVAYYHQGAEAQKDILRWLAIYQRRLDPSHRFEFPAHHPRYRGFCMIRRAWPSGLRWEAFNEATWFRAPISPEREREPLERAIDRQLELGEMRPRAGEEAAD